VYVFPLLKLWHYLLINTRIDRGEAANHGIADVASYLRELFRDGTGATTLKEKVDTYESEMIERCGPAVLRSRQACIDAHDYPSISENSPLIMKRVIIVTKE
jgi:hypothetical protein